MQTDEDVLLRVQVSPDTTSSDVNFEVQRLLPLYEHMAETPAVVNMGPKASASQVEAYEVSSACAGTPGQATTRSKRRGAA